MTISVGTVKTIVVESYWSEPKSRAMNIVPTEEIKVEITSTLLIGRR